MPLRHLPPLRALAAPRDLDGQDIPALFAGRLLRGRRSHARPLCFLLLAIVREPQPGEIHQESEQRQDGLAAGGQADFSRGEQHGDLLFVAILRFTQSQALNAVNSLCLLFDELNRDYSLHSTK